MSGRVFDDKPVTKRDRTHCAYCGAPSVSYDHVPPKNLFPADQTNLITVPACDEHNGKLSDLDEDFRNYVAAHSGGDTKNTKLLLEKAVRGVRRHTKIQRWRPDFSAFEVTIDSKSFIPMIDQITRGLYWHAYGDRLPSDTKMRIGKLRIGEWLPAFVSDMNRFVIAGSQFCCAYDRMGDYPTISVWVYVFHNRIVAMAMTDLALQAELDAKL